MVTKPKTTKEFLVDILQEDGVRPERIEWVLAHPVETLLKFKTLIKEFIEIYDTCLENAEEACLILCEAFCNWYSCGLHKEEDYAMSLNNIEL